MKARVLVVVLCAFDLSKSIEINPIVTVKQGKVRGKISESRIGRKYAQFLGLPYSAKPKRFQPAGPPPKWEGLRDGTGFGPKCIQWDSNTDDVTGDEDCLSVNVYTPVYSDPKQTTLPVMVYIHGTSFVKGSGSEYGPDYFMDEDVILVTFNYRLGAFGFLTTLNKNMIPNLGMKDQVAALMWVKDNIRSFGGDDNRITIFGSGAGAASVSYHILSPLSTGLFHYAVSQSGNVLCPWALVRNPLDIAMELGKLLNCSTANTFTIAACLKVTAADEIVAKQEKLLEWKINSASFYPFGPVIELLHQSIETGPMFLPESPKQLIREGRFQKIPWMTGVNSADGLTYAAALVLNNTRMMQKVNKYWPRIAPLAFSYKDTAPTPAIVSRRIRDYYFRDGINSEATENFTRALSDGNFFRCTKNCALVYAQQSPVWVYYFTHERTANILHRYGLDDLDVHGVPHNDELQYFFQMDLVPVISTRSRYFQFSQNLIKLWTSFAKTGTPTAVWGQVEKWEPVPPGQVGPDVSISMYKIDKDTEIVEEPFFERIGFWDKLRLFPQTQNPIASIATDTRARDDHRSSFSSSGSKRSSTLAAEGIAGIIYVQLFLQTFLRLRIHN